MTGQEPSKLAITVSAFQPTHFDKRVGDKGHSGSYDEG
jgi:hypothetical protein